SRGIGPLARFVRERLASASDDEALQATELALEIIEAVPIFLARAEQEAEARGLTEVIRPILGHVEQYFLKPIDLIPEMTYGLAGLLDDTYLVLRILENLDRGPNRFLDWDLAHPLAFLRRLIGEGVAQSLDERSIDAMQEISDDVRTFWERASLRA